MKLNFTFKHLDRSEALEAHTVEAMDSIGRFLLKDGQGTVLISKKDHEFCVEISVNTRQKYFRAVASHPDPYFAVDSVAQKLERQFLKTRQVVQKHRSHEMSKAGRLERLNAQFEPQIRFKKAA